MILIQEYKSLIQQAQMLLKEQYPSRSWVQADKETFQFFLERAEHKPLAAAKPEPKPMPAPPVKPGSAPEPKPMPAPPIKPGPKPKPMPAPPIKPGPRPKPKPMPAPPIKPESSQQSFSKESLSASTTDSFDDIQGLVSAISPSLAQRKAPPSHEKIRTETLRKAHIVFILSPPKEAAEKRLVKDLLLGLNLCGLPSALCKPHEPLSTNEMPRLRLIVVLGKKPKNISESVPFMTFPAVSEWVDKPETKSTFWAKLMTSLHNHPESSL